MKIRNIGSVPVPYIIALVLAIIVLAIIAYWLFFSGTDFGRIIIEAGCKSKKMAYCNEWKTTGTKPAEEGFSAECNTANAADEGIINLGKYTLVIRLALPTRLLPEADTAFAK